MTGDLSGVAAPESVPGPRLVPPAVDSGTPIGWFADNVGFAYPRATRPTLDGVSLTIAGGCCTALIGPNGSGKSSLIRLLLGSLKADSGEIRLGGRPLDRWSRRELARTVGVVPQHEEITFPLTVRELVAMGRYPHLGPLRPAGARDQTAIESAMHRCNVHGLADRTIDTLSGGERQRARIARALAQEPIALVLDEPTRALDVGHEMSVFELTRKLADDGATVLLATHHLNLASRFADELILLDAGRLIATGPPADVLDRERLEQVYDWPIQLTAHPGPGPDTGAVQVAPLARFASPTHQKRNRPS